MLPTHSTRHYVQSNDVSEDFTPLWLARTTAPEHTRTWCQCYPRAALLVIQQGVQAANNALNNYCSAKAACTRQVCRSATTDAHLPKKGLTAHAEDADQLL
jgi:hypothetical protein